MYARFGNVWFAQYVFDEMPQRNEASWSTAIAGYVRVGLYEEALWLFIEMWGGEGIWPNGYMLASLITACSRSEIMVCQGIQIHGLVVKIGWLSDVFVSSALLHFYGNHGFVLSARKFFDEMPERNVVSWTSLMVGYSNYGCFEEVVEIYGRMRREGVNCNSSSFATIISACGSLEDELFGSQVLAHVLVSGFMANVSVANALIFMFGSCGNVDDAYYVFDRMDEHDIISWNSLISAYSHNQLCEESLQCFRWMRRFNEKPNSTTLSSLISACTSVDDLKWGKGIHGAVVKHGLHSVCVCNTLVTMYSVSGKCEEAELLFQEMPEKDLISWNSMMSAYVQNGDCQIALQVFADLLKTSKCRNHVSFATALAACSYPEALIKGKSVHALILRGEFHDNLLLGNALITMYGKCGAMKEAEQVFSMMPAHDGITWNALIGGYMEKEESNKVVSTFKLMRDSSIALNYITMVHVLCSFSSPSELQNLGKPVHGYLVQAGFESDSYVQNSLLTMYAKCGDLYSTNFLFDRLVNKSVVSWNAMIAANSHHGRGEDALKLFVEMHESGLELDQFSLTVGLAANAGLGFLEEGQQIHSLIVKLGFKSDLDVANAVMDMYGKCGEMEDVLRMVPESTNRSRLIWNTLISVYSRHGYFEKAKETFHQMLEQGPKPDHVTFVALLSACNHGGLVHEGLSYFSSMTAEFKIPPGIEHCVCIIDLLGRSGRLAEAEKFIAEMPVHPNDLVWRSLLSACRTHNNLDLGKKAAEHLLELDPSDDSAYVLLSNICAINGRWEDVNHIRAQMKSIQLKKKPACSWVKVNNKVSTFGIGDKSHPQSIQIYTKLKDLMNMIRQSGYVPDTTFALHDTDEEQKEHNLWNHSEKLALAFALLNTPKGSKIKVFKNLRVCGDCHSVYKYVSLVVHREIVLRDPYRFHHFREGKCSCLDYW
ncbi:hypothetical protein Sjap_017038 [Stephania japonica]|uniref:DYW domain-containing protein n=1 Tax=Stephania japonica TaxID=461633 RepID=A0AAP0I5I1_9MAGN